MSDPAKNKARCDAVLMFLAVPAVSVGLWTPLFATKWWRILEVPSLLVVSVPIFRDLLDYPVFVTVLVGPGGNLFEIRKR